MLCSSGTSLKGTDYLFYFTLLFKIWLFLFLQRRSELELNLEPEPPLYYGSGSSQKGGSGSTTLIMYVLVFSDRSCPNIFIFIFCLHIQKVCAAESTPPTAALVFSRSHHFVETYVGTFSTFVQIPNMIILSSIIIIWRKIGIYNTYSLQCWGAATFLGGSRSLRSWRRLRLLPNRVGSGSRQKRRLQVAPAPYTKICHFELLKSLLLMQVFYWIILFTFINCSQVMFYTSSVVDPKTVGSGSRILAQFGSGSGSRPGLY